MKAPICINQSSSLSEGGSLRVGGILKFFTLFSTIEIVGRANGTSDGFAILTRGLEGLVLKCLLSSVIICLSRDLAFLPPKTTPIILCPFLSTEATRLNPEAEV